MLSKSVLVVLAVFVAACAIPTLGTLGLEIDRYPTLILSGGQVEGDWPVPERMVPAEQLLRRGRMLPK